MTDDPIDELPDAAPEPREPSRLVGVDDRGYRVGEDHPRAKLTDHEVELIRQLYETRDEWDGSMSKIAEKFEISKTQVVDIVNFKRRASAAVGWRRVRLVVNGHERNGTGAQVARTDVRDLL